MELRHFRYFLAVVEARSFTRAASALEISQPTLSHQIRQLEDAVGAALFLRLGRKISLTVEGEVLLPHAKDAVRAADDAVRSIAEASSALGGKLHLACFPSLNAFIGHVAASFLEQFPKVQIIHQELRGTDLRHAVQNGDVELGFAVRYAAPKDMLVQPLFKEPLVLAFRTGHRLAKCKKIGVDDIGDTPFITFGYETFTQNAINTFFDRAGFKPNICIEAASTEIMLHVIAESDAVGFVPESLAKSFEGISFYRDFGRWPAREIAIYSNARAITSSASKEFCKIALAHAKLIRKKN